jgi:hypothetical protein
MMKKIFGSVVVLLLAAYGVVSAIPPSPPAAPASSGIAPAHGSDTYLQFNDGGFIGSDGNLTWNKSTDTLGAGLHGTINTQTLNAGTTAVGGNINVNATLGSELVTWSTAGMNEDNATWTFTTSTGTLTHVTGNTTTLTVSATIVAGTTYKVTITGTGAGATATYTLGGVTGTTIAASGAIAITDYITASTTGALIITPSSTCTVAITAISIKALTDATGDLTVDGNLRVRSQALFAGGYDAATTSVVPPISFLNDPDTGLRLYSGANILGFVTGGSHAGYITSTQWVQPSSATFVVGSSVTLTGESSNVLQFGSDAATASAQKLKGPDSSTASVAGGDLSIQGGTPGAGGVYGAVKLQPDGGNLLIGGASAGTSLAKGISVYAGTAPSDSPADSAQIWVADRQGVAGKAALHMRDEEGNTGSIAFTKRFTKTTSATPATLGANEVCHATVFVGTTNTTLNLPQASGGTAVLDGCEVVFEAIAAVTITVDPYSSEVINHLGTDLTGGVTVVSDGYAGSKIRFLYDGTASKWRTRDTSGLWVAGS